VQSVTLQYVVNRSAQSVTHQYLVNRLVQSVTLQYFINRSVQSVTHQTVVVESTKTGRSSHPVARGMHAISSVYIGLLIVSATYT